MASSTEHNPAAHDPAVLRWDWEKTKIMSCPSEPKKSSCENEHFMRSELPRAGTLKRSNAFVGGEATELIGGGSLRDGKSRMKKHDGYSGNFKLAFPETLYSEAKRRAVEDMGSRFMRTIQKLDRGDLKEPVDFNLILERHWAELAEFYSEQVSTVRKLEQKFKATTTSSLGNLPPASPPQLPPYLMSQLSELKLRPFVFTKSEKKPDPASHSESVESKRLFDEPYITKSPENKQTVAEVHGTPDESRQKEITREVQNLMRWSYGTPHWGETKVTDAGPFVTDSLFTGETHGTVYSTCMENDQSDKSIFVEATQEGVHGSLRPGLEIPVVELATKSQLELGPYISSKAAGENLAKYAQPVEPEAARLMDTKQFNFRGVEKNENSQRVDIEKARGQDPGKPEETYPIIRHLIENYKALAVVMRLAAMNLDDPHETCSETSLNDHLVECNTDGTEGGGDPGSFPPEPVLQLNPPPPPQPTDHFAIAIQGEIDPRSVVDKHIQQSQDRPESDCEYMYRFGPASAGAGTVNLFMHNGETAKTSDLPNVEFSPYDTLVCTPKKVALDGSRTVLLPIGHPAVPSQSQTKATTESVSDYYLDIAVAESLPHDSSNDSFSVSDDSYLFSGSTKDELEKLQMEVKDHLEQAERQGLLVSRWGDDSRIKKKKIDRLNEEDEASNLAGDQGPLNYSYEKGCEEEEGSDHDERIEVFEFEYVDDCEDSGDDDGEIDQEMDKILAWIALEDAKAEATMQSSKAMVKFDKSRIEELVDTDGDDEEGTEEIVVATRLVVEKELSVVDEEESEDDDGAELEEENEYEEGRKVEEENKMGEVGSDEKDEYGKVEADNKGMEMEETIMGTKEDNMEVRDETRDTKVEKVGVKVAEEKSDHSVRAEESKE